MSLPKMARCWRDSPDRTNHHMAFETLTHAGMGAIGVPPLR